MHFGFKNVILLHGDNCHVWATHVVIFRVVKCTNTNILTVCRDHSTVKIQIFLLKFRLNGKKVTSIKCQK